LIVFQQYAAESKYLETALLDLTQIAPSKLDSTDLPSVGFLLGDEEILTTTYDDFQQSKEHHQNAREQSLISISDDHLPKSFSQLHAISSTDASLAKPTDHLAKKSSLAHAKPHFDL
jgi:hypothetical protein